MLSTSLRDQAVFNLCQQNGHNTSDLSRGIVHTRFKTCFSSGQITCQKFRVYPFLQVEWEFILSPSGIVGSESIALQFSGFQNRRGCGPMPKPRAEQKWGSRGFCGSLQYPLPSGLLPGPEDLADLPPLHSRPLYPRCWTRGK